MNFLRRIFRALSHPKLANAAKKQPLPPQLANTPKKQAQPPRPPQPASTPKTQPLPPRSIPASTPTNQATTTGSSPKSLLGVVETGDIAAIQQSLKQGADVNTVNDIGETPLICASYLGYADAVKLLLAAGANVDAAVNNGATALFVASQNGHAGVVKRLLGAGANVNVTRRSDGSTSLLAASGEGHADVVELLLAAGGDVNISVDDGTTPLHIASHRGHADVVTLLRNASRRGGLEPAAQPDNKCKRHPEYPTIGACQCGRVICKECIRRQTTGPNSFSGRQGSHVGCVWCLPNGETPPRAVVEFMERDFIERASGK